MPIHCKIVNRGNSFAKLVRGHPVAHMIAVNTRDTERFYSLVDSSPSTLDRGPHRLNNYDQLNRPYSSTNRTSRSA